MKHIRIATRKSPLAIRQAEIIQNRIIAAHPGITIELVGMTTEGDRKLGMPLATVGGKGLFIKELEQALFENRADIAVHSMKDMTLEIPQGLVLTAICEREETRDAFVSNRFKTINDLPIGATMGTASLRRQCQTLAIRPDLNVQTLRGNVNTRLRRLDDDKFDAIILAGAGLVRLDLQERIQSYLGTDIYLPAVAQGALGIECRSDDNNIHELLAFLEHKPTRICITAERAFNRGLQGGCQVPIAGYAIINQSQLSLRGMVGRPDGTLVLSGQVQGAPEEAERLGQQLAQQLLDQGAGQILTEVYENYGHAAGK